MTDETLIVLALAPVGNTQNIMKILIIDQIQMGFVGKYILIQMHDALFSNDNTDYGNILHNSFNLRGKT